MAEILPLSKELAERRKSKRSSEGGSEGPEFSELGRKDRKQAIALLVAKYRRPLFRHALHMLRNPEEAYDITQEVFLRAYKESRLFDDGFHVRGWLYRVTANLCLKRLRSKKVRSLFAQKTKNEPKMSVATPAIQAFAGEVREEVADALEKLSPRFKSLIVLRYYNDLSYKEIAEAMDMPIGSVMSGLSRAREKLKKHLGSRLNEEERFE